MIHNYYTCDNCEFDLTSCGPMDDYRIELRAKKIDNNFGYSSPVQIIPPIDRCKHFCDMNCLKEWINKNGQKK